MKYDDEDYNPYASFEGGCSVHGEDYMRECTICGIEFCAICFPNSELCSDCAAQNDDLDDEEDLTTSDGDKEEMRIVNELAPDDPEIEKETAAALSSFGEVDDDESAPPEAIFIAASVTRVEKLKIATSKSAQKTKKADSKAKKHPSKPKKTIKKAVKPAKSAVKTSKAAKSGKSASKKIAPPQKTVKKAAKPVAKSKKTAGKKKK